MASGRPLRIAGGNPAGAPQDQAQIDLHRALARNGVESTLRGADLSANVMAEKDRMEAAVDRGEIPAGAVDEGGMLLVDLGLVDVGVNFREQVDWAYRGLVQYQPYPLRNLRGIARIHHPRYVGVAAIAESGITSLEQIGAERRPIRLATVSKSKHQTRTMGYITSRIFELSGFTQADVIDWGGSVATGNEAMPAVAAAEIDVIALPLYAAWANWGAIWQEAQIRMDLRFLPVSEHVREAMVGELGLRKGVLPAYLYKGLTSEVPTFAMPDYTVYANAGLENDLAYAVAKALDDHPDCLLVGTVAFAYHPRMAWQDLPVPLHPGAEAYYRDHGYMEKKP